MQKEGQQLKAKSIKKKQSPGNIQLASIENILFQQKKNQDYGKICEVVFQFPAFIGREEEDKEQSSHYQKIVGWEFKYFDIQATLIKNQYVLEPYDIRIQPNGFKWIFEYFEDVLINMDVQKLCYTKKLQIIYCIAQSLFCLSQKGICNRALSPASICISSENNLQIQAKLMNFRSVYILDPKIKMQKQYSDINQKKMNEIQNRYTAPQLRRNQSPNIKSDIWSLGAIFYELVFNDLKRIKVNSNSIEIGFLQGTPNWMRSIFQGMLQFDPNRRYSASHTVSILKSATICAQTTQKWLADLEAKNSLSKPN